GLPSAQKHQTEKVRPPGPALRRKGAMTLERVKGSRTTEWPLSPPATLAAAALLTGLLAAALGQLAPAFLVPFRVVLIVGALLAAGVAVWWRLSGPAGEFEDRVWAATVVAAASGTVLACREAMSEDWEALRM